MPHDDRLALAGLYLRLISFEQMEEAFKNTILSMPRGPKDCTLVVSLLC